MSSEYDFEALIRSIVKEEIELYELNRKPVTPTVSKSDEWGGYGKATNQTGLSRTRIQRLIDAGKVEAYQESVGGHWHINVSSILRFLETEAKEMQKENKRRATA